MRPVLGLFDRAYYINLDRREDRRSRMEAVLKGMDIEAERFPAVEYKKKVLSIYNLWINPHQLAIYSCLESHLKVLEKAAAEEAKSVLVLEDDIVPAPAWSSHPRVLEELAGKKWDAFWFYGGDKPWKQDGGLRRFDPEPPWGAYAYAVNGPAIPAVVNLIRKAYGKAWWYPLDGIYVSFLKGDIFAPEQDLIRHDYSFKSDIR